VDINLLIVATGFRVAGWVLGVPSLVSLLGLGIGSFSLFQSPPIDPSQDLDIKTYGLIALLARGAEYLGKTLEFLTGMVAWVVAILLILSLVTLLFAVVLYVTGRGIGNHATWARILAILISLGFLVSSVGVLMILRRDLAALACVPIGMSLYMLWALCWRFA
jgi:hypothetical protein